MKHIIPILAVFCIVLLVLASGCGSISRDTVKGKNFGNTFGATTDELKVKDCFTNLYGDLSTTGGNPRFLEPLITTGLDKNNLPINNVVTIPTTQDPVYFFVIYDNFPDKSSVTIRWLYSSDTSKEVAKVVNLTGPDYGRFIIEFQKPDAGWSPGTQMIQVTSGDMQKTILFTVGDKLETQHLNCSADSTTGSTSQASASTGTSCRPSCTVGTKCNDEQDCASGFCVQGVCSAVPVKQTTCSDNVWNGNWDTRWTSEGRSIAPDPAYPGSPWSGDSSEAATPVQLTQNNCDVTGTYVPSDNPGGKGTITAKIEGNQLIGNYNAIWPGSEDHEWGTFTLKMDAGSQSWIGYAKGHDRGDFPDPDNWIGRRAASTDMKTIANPTSGLTYRPTLTQKTVVLDTRLVTPTTTVTTTITPSCPASIWGGKWGTKWNSYENGDTIVDLWSGSAANWDGYVTTPVTMTQNCWGVTGTIAFQPDCIGTITSGTIDKNDQNHLTGGWVTTGCEAESGNGYTGQFSVNMDNNKHGWIGKLISVNDPYADRDYQDNWAGKPA